MNEKLTGKRPKVAIADCDPAASSLSNYQPSRNQKPRCAMQRLPRETVQHIAQFLPTSSAAALALTSKWFLFVLGRQYFNQVRGEFCNEGELRKFLLLIERDIPGYYGCLDCLRLHAFEYALPLRRRMLQRLTTSKDLPCKGVDDDAEAALFNNRPIKFLDLHNLMRQHRAGNLDPTALHRLSSLKPKNNDDASVQRSLEFRVVSDELLMRGMYKFPTDLTGSTIQNFKKRLYICPHFLYNEEFGNKIQDMLRCVSMHLNTLRDCAKCKAPDEKQQCISSGLGIMESQESWMQCTSLQSCESCPAEFQIRVEQRDLATFGIVIIRYINMGGVETPYSPKYRSLMYHRSCRWVNGKAVPLLSWRPGSIRAAFGD